MGHFSRRMAALAVLAALVGGVLGASADADAAVNRPAGVALDTTWKTGLSRTPLGITAEADGSLLAWFDQAPTFSGRGWYSDTNTTDSADTAYPDGNGTPDPTRLIRIRADGTLDVLFSKIGGYFPQDVAVQADGKIIVATDGGSDIAGAEVWNGTSVTAGGQWPTGGLSRIDARGVLDGTFRPQNTGFNNQVKNIEIAPDGRIYALGDFTSFTGPTWNGTTRDASLTTVTTISKIARLLPDGTLDLTFQNWGLVNNTVNDMKVLSDGSVILGGAFTSYTGLSWNGSALSSDPAATVAVGRILKLRTDGSLDRTFSSDTSSPNFSGTGFDGPVAVLAVGPNNAIYAGGSFGTFNGRTSTAGVLSGSASTSKMGNLARITSTGAFDVDFRSATTALTTGAAGPNAAVQAIAVDQDGGVWIAGQSIGNFTGKTDSAGTLAGGGSAVTRTVLLRLTANGAIDITASPSSGTSTTGSPAKLATGPGGRVFVQNILRYKGLSWNGSTTAADALTLVPSNPAMLWGANTVPIVYSPNGGTGAMTWTSTPTGSSSVTLASNRFANGSGTFTGWNTAADGSGLGYLAGASFPTPGDPTVLYAQWSGGSPGPSSSTFGSVTSPLPAPAPSSYSVSYDSAGGSTINTSTSVNSFTPGVSFNLPSAPTRGGYSFAGWTYSSGSPSSTASGDATVTSSATANLTLTAQWTPRSDNAVTYALNSGTAGANAGATTYMTASAFTLPSAPTRNGYTFAGWQVTGTNATTATTAANASTATVTGYGAVTLTAQWAGINSNTVSYDLNSGSAGSGSGAATYTTGSSFTLPGTPSRTGYDFAGWEISGTNAATSTTAANATSASVSGYGNVLLTAQWLVQSFAVSIDANGGTGATGGAASYSFGSTFTLPSSPFRGGYDFAGWQITGPLATTVTTMPGAVTASVTGTGAITLTAQWTAHTTNAVTYALASGTAGSGAGASSYSTGSSFSLPGTPTRGGYTFAGWQITGTNAATATLPANASSASVTGYGSVTLTAQWTAVSSNTVSYALASGTAGTGSGDSTYTTGIAFTLPGAPTRTGFDFAGWEISGTNASTLTTAAIATTATVSGFGNVTLTAQWTARTYSITIDPAGGAGATGGASQYGTGSAFTLPSQPVLGGYTFTGWTMTGPTVSTATTAPGAVSASVNGYGAVTLTAGWTARTDNAVSYLLNSGTAGVGTGASNYTTNASFLLPGAPTRGGYAFAGWALSGVNAASATIAAQASQVTVSGYGAVTLSAQWAGLTTNTVSYDLNGGVAGTAAGAASYTTGSSFALPSAPSKSGSTFDGWNITGANAITATTTPSASTATVSGYDNVLLTATWVIAQSVSPSASPSVSPSTSVTTGSTTNSVVSGGSTGSATVATETISELPSAASSGEPSAEPSAATDSLASSDSDATGTVDAADGPNPTGTDQLMLTVLAVLIGLGVVGAGIAQFLRTRR